MCVAGDWRFGHTGVEELVVIHRRHRGCGAHGGFLAPQCWPGPPGWFSPGWSEDRPPTQRRRKTRGRSGQSTARVRERKPRRVWEGTGVAQSGGQERDDRTPAPQWEDGGRWQERPRGGPGWPATHTGDRGPGRTRTRSFQRHRHTGGGVARAGIWVKR